jgi:hypothetical protein
MHATSNTAYRDRVSQETFLEVQTAVTEVYEINGLLKYESTVRNNTLNTTTLLRTNLLEIIQFEKITTSRPLGGV